MKKQSIVLILCSLLLCSACSSEASKPPAPEPYVQESWPQFSPVAYNTETQTLTLTQSSTMTYDSACLHGQEVYADELALETYLESVQMIAYDVSTACQLDSLQVILQGVSSDGKTIYTISNRGDIWACWSADPQ